MGLRRFVDRFPNSGIQLQDPPGKLKIQGVKHVVTFARTQDPDRAAPLRILVEVVQPTDAEHDEWEPMDVRLPPFNWKTKVRAPTLEGFFAQKFGVLGPRTIGREMGPNATHAQPNQSVAKQIFDLHVLLRQPLDGTRIREAYTVESADANQRRSTNHPIQTILRDAADLLEALRGPRPAGAVDGTAYRLWTAHDETRRLIRDRTRWDAIEYRVAGGVLRRVADDLRADRLRWDTIRTPVTTNSIPASKLAAIEAALGRNETWVPPGGFGGAARIAWAWSPESYW